MNLMNVWRTDGQTYRQTDGWTDGLKDSLLALWTEGWKDGWTDGIMDKPAYGGKFGTLESELVSYRILIFCY